MSAEQHLVEVPNADAFESSWDKDPVKQYEEQEKNKVNVAEKGKGATTWSIPDTIILLSALRTVEMGGGTVPNIKKLSKAAAKKAGKQHVTESITVKTGDGGLSGPAQSYIAWVLKTTGSEQMQNVTNLQVRNKFTAIRNVWQAIKTLNSCSGGPFTYDEEKGYGHIQGQMGLELDNMVKGDQQACPGRSSDQVSAAVAVRPYRKTAWPLYKLCKEVWEDILQQSTRPTGTLALALLKDIEGEESQPEWPDSDVEEDAVATPSRASKRKKVSGDQDSANKKASKTNYAREQADQLIREVGEMREATASSHAANVIQQELNRRKFDESLEHEQIKRLETASKALGSISQFNDATRAERGLIMDRIRQNPAVLTTLPTIMQEEWVEDNLEAIRAVVDESEDVGSPEISN